MTDLSRRRFLVASGTLGALGALTAVVPPAAAWTSVDSLGTASGADPKWVWDAEADPLVAGLIDRGQVPQVNALLKTWTKNGQALPDGLPADLRDFIESARRLPSWADPARLKAVTGFTARRGTYLGVLYAMGSGMMSTAIPHEARAVYYSKGGADMKDRIAKTAKLGYDIGTPNAYQPDGEMIVTTVKTRLVHAAVRHLLPQSPGWSAVNDEPIPISQADMLVTWNSLATFTMHKLKDWGVQVGRADSDAYLHLWQLSAHMLGIRDEFIPASWDAANAQSKQLLDPVLGPTPEGVELADTLLDLAAQIDGGASRPFLNAFTRYTLGGAIADWLELPDDPKWDRFVRTYWPIFVAGKEGFGLLPLTPTISWTFDELLRQGVLLFLNDGKPISITIPDGNRPA